MLEPFQTLQSGPEGPPVVPLTHRWRKTRNAAGLDGLKLHDCRHFYASGLIAHGADVVTSSEL
jgi:integrase